jgi:hypothetical protein
VFRRRGSGQAEAPAAPTAGTAEEAPPGATRPGMTPRKGRPTPKRSEAERRRQPYSAPRDRKSASADYRARQREERQRRYQAMQRGEEWALPPRDRGAVKGLARDYVDSRRRLSEYYMYALIVLMVMVFIKSVLVQTVIPLLVIVLVVVMLAEGALIGRKVRALAQQRFPGQPTRGLAMYAAMRAMQIRRFRMPKPRVKPGDSY